jgi:hypothetical protein
MKAIVNAPFELHECEAETPASEFFWIAIFCLGRGGRNKPTIHGHQLPIASTLRLLAEFGGL